MSDPSTLRSLFRIYWTSNGWRDPKVDPPAPEDLDAAQAAGFLFPVVSFSHSEIVKMARLRAAAFTPQQAGDSFAASLSSRELTWRSVLASFAVAASLPEGEVLAPMFQGAVDNRDDLGEKNWDRSVLNFERHKWGGVRHGSLSYAAFDLGEFAAIEPPRPTPADVELLAELLEIVRTAPEGTTASTLHRLLPKAIPSNKAERDTLIAILGVAGVLSTPEHRGFHAQFVLPSQRATPRRRFVDMPYPACWWTSEHGVFEPAVRTWFGHLV